MSILYTEMSQCDDWAAHRPLQRSVKASNSPSLCFTAVINNTEFNTWSAGCYVLNE